MQVFPELGPAREAQLETRHGAREPDDTLEHARRDHGITLRDEDLRVGALDDFAHRQTAVVEAIGLPQEAETANRRAAIHRGHRGTSLSVERRARRRVASSI